MTETADTPEPLSEAQLAEIEARANGPGGYSAKAYADRSALLAEVRRLAAENARLRGLFSEADVRLLDEVARDVPRGTDRMLDNLIGRIREAIGEPRFIGQAQADAIIQSMIDDGEIGEDTE